MKRLSIVTLLSLLLVGCQSAATLAPSVAPASSSSPAASSAAATSASGAASPAVSSSAAQGSTCGTTGGTLVFGTTADPQTLDAVSAGDSESDRIVRQIFEGLVRLKPGSPSDVEPDLAQSWTISPDGKTYTFHLQPNVTFQDGTPFDAQAALYNVMRWKNLPAGLQGYDYYVRAVLGGYGNQSIISSAEASGNDLIIHLTVPRSNFLISLTLPTFMMQSPTALKAHNADLGPDPKDDYSSKAPTGTGPFMFNGDWVQGDHYTVVRNPNYWDKANAACLDSIAFKIISDSSQRVTTLLSGGADIVDLVPANLVSQITSAQGYQLLKRDPLDVGWIGFNQRHKPFDDLKVREAVAYAINRQPIVQTFFPSFGQVADSDILPSFAAYQPGVYPSSYDPAKAKQLLASSSCQAPCQIDFWYPDNVSRPYMVDPAQEFQAIQQMLQAVGFKVVPHHELWGQYLTHEADGEYPIWMIGGVYDYADPGDELALNYAQGLTPCQGKTPSTPLNCEYGEQNQQAYNLMQQALSQADPAQATTLWKQAEKLWGADVPKVPIVWTGSALAASSNVHGYVPNATQAEYLNTVWKSK